MTSLVMTYILYSHPQIYTSLSNSFSIRLDTPAHSGLYNNAMHSALEQNPAKKNVSDNLSMVSGSI